MNTKERRTAQRIPAYDILPHAVTRLFTGQEVGLMNIGLNGSVLVRSKTMLAPGSPVRLSLEIPGTPLFLAGRVQRCRVVGLNMGEVRYEAAILLNDGLPLLLAELVQSLEARKTSQQSSAQDANEAALPATAELFVLSAQESRQNP